MRRRQFIEFTTASGPGALLPSAYAALVNDISALSPVTVGEHGRANRRSRQPASRHARVKATGVVRHGGALHTRTGRHDLARRAGRDRPAPVVGESHAGLRELIDAALANGGRYYLPYRLYATPEQFARAYPEAAAFRKLKQRVDPDKRMRNLLWDKYLNAWHSEDTAMKQYSYYFDFYDSPLGRMLLTATPRALTGVHFVGEKYYPQIDPEWQQKPRARMIARARKQLREYFEGKRTVFDLPLEPDGTPFQRDVWQQLLRIPFATTTHYGEVARRLGNANAMRAVGAANGRNPISIIIPCHRVIGADKDLTGYAGGLARKDALLKLEARVSLAKGEFRLTPG